MLIIFISAFLRYKEKLDALDYMVLTTLGAGIELCVELIALIALTGG